MKEEEEVQERIDKKIKRRRTSQFYLIWLRFKRNKLAVVGLFFVLVMIMISLLSPWISPHDPFVTRPLRKLEAPSLEFPLGTDALGRCVLSRLFFGSRIALKIGVLIILFEGSIGIFMGLVSGFFGGWVDEAVMRLVDILRSFPVIVLAMAIAGIMGQGVYNVVIALGIVGWTTYARMVRSKILSIKEEKYVEAARCIGEPTYSVILRYVLPNAIPTVIVMMAIMMPTALIASATLSFLGVGVQPPMPSWGSMVSAGRDYLLEAPWISTSAGFFIMFTVLGFNFLGDGLRDSLDPTTKHR